MVLGTTLDSHDRMTQRRAGFRISRRLDIKPDQTADRRGGEAFGLDGQDAVNLWE